MPLQRRERPIFRYLPWQFVGIFTLYSEQNYLFEGYLALGPKKGIFFLFFLWGCIRPSCYKIKGEEYPREIRKKSSAISDRMFIHMKEKNGESLAAEDKG